MRLSILLALVPLVASPAAPARACIGEAPGIEKRTLWTGKTPPRNVQPVVTYDRAAETWGVPSPLGMDLLLRAADGTPVETTTEQKGPGTFVLHPQAPLVPGQRYEVLDRRLVPCLGEDCSHILDQPQLIDSFTPTDVTDTEAPTFAGLEQVAVGNFSECEDCCMPHGGYPISFVSRPGDLSEDDVRFNIYYRRNSAAALELLASLVPGELVGDPAKGLQRFITPALLLCTGHSQQALTLLPGSYLVRAVDAAGNEDSNMNFQVLGTVCYGAGSTEPPPSTVEHRSVGGCALVGPRPPHGWWLLPAVAALVLARRRARFRLRS